MVSIKCFFEALFKGNAQQLFSIYDSFSRASCAEIPGKILS
jgi:hypothetical protein